MRIEENSGSGVWLDVVFARLAFDTTFFFFLSHCVLFSSNFCGTVTGLSFMERIN